MTAEEATNPPEKLFVEAVLPSSSSENASALSHEATFDLASETETSSCVCNAPSASNCSLRCFFVRCPPKWPLVVGVAVVAADPSDIDSEV